MADSVTEIICEHLEDRVELLEEFIRELGHVPPAHKTGKRMDERVKRLERYRTTGDRS